MFEIHPALPLLAASAISAVAGTRLSRAVSLAGPALAAVLAVTLPAEASAGAGVLGHRIELLRIDALSRVFALAFTGFALMASLYAWGADRRGVRAAGTALAAAGVGVVLAGDFLALFLSWEALSMLSLYLIWSGRTDGAWNAGIRYALFHVAGAACLLAGIILRARATGTYAFEPVGLDGPAGWLILIGFAVNAAVPPLHAWLPDAYPRSSVWGTVFLSAFTTKAAVYALARGFPGEEILVWAGAAMALYGVIFAVLENDIIRLLAYHIVSQVGYMVCGVGLGTALAVDGVAAHAFSHIFYKGLLLMAAGAVIHATGRSRLTDLGGLGRAMPVTLALYFVGAFSISGAPLLNGFVSKSMIVGAADESGRSAVFILLTVASMGTFLHTGLKLPWFTFFGPPRDLPPPGRVPRSMIAAMVLAAAVCVGTGVAPGLLYALLPNGAPYRPYTADHVAGSVQLLVGTALGFWLLRKKLAGEPTVTRDVDTLYRRPAAGLALGLGRLLEWPSKVFRPVMAGLTSSSLRPVRWMWPSTVAGQVAILVAALTSLVFAVLNGILV